MENLDSSGSSGTAKITFYQVAAEWLESKKGNVKQSSYVHYTNVLVSHVLPTFGDQYLENIGREQLNDFFQSKLKSGRLDGAGGLSAKTVSDIRMVMSQIFQFSYDSRHINHTFRLSSVPVQRTPIAILSRKEQKQLEAVLFSSSEPVCLGTLLSLYTGMRIGEICALLWGDFDFEEGIVHITKTVQRIQNINLDANYKTSIVIQRPKTVCSVRTIPMPDFIADYIGRFRKSSDSYFLTGSKKLMEPRRCLRRYKTILREAGIHDYTFHVLRHTFSTRCVENEFDIKTLSEILGHSNVKITMERYVHPTLDMKRKQMNRLKKL